MCPAPGAGICWTLITDPDALLPRVELARTCTSRRVGNAERRDNGRESGEEGTQRSIRGVMP